MCLGRGASLHPLYSTSYPVLHIYIYLTYVSLTCSLLRNFLTMGKPFFRRFIKRAKDSSSSPDPASNPPSESDNPVMTFLVARDIDRQGRAMNGGFPLPGCPTPERRMARVHAAVVQIITGRAGEYANDPDLIVKLMTEFEDLVVEDMPVWDGATRDLHKLLEPHIAAQHPKCLGLASALSMNIKPGRRWVSDSNARGPDPDRAHALARAGAHAGDDDSIYRYASLVHSHVVFEHRIAALDSGEVPPASREAADRAVHHLGPRAAAASADAFARLAAIAGRVNQGKVWYQLGMMCAYDLRDVNQLKRAREYFDKAAELGSGEAHFELYLFDVNGFTGPPDPHAALMHIADAADLGHHRSIANLGGLYFTGMLGVPIDHEKGFQLYYHAVSKGSARAARILATMHATGEDGCPIDPEQAQRLMLRADQLEGKA